MMGKLKKKKIVLIHGWPDHVTLWKYQIPELTKFYDCYRIKLPNYDKNAKTYEGPHSWGYDLVEVAKSINACIKTRIQENENEKVTLLIHDWGSFVGYLAYKNDSNLYERIVSVDVGDSLGIHGVSSFFGVLGYQWYNVFCFLLPGFIGNIFNQLVPRIVSAPLIREKKAYEIHSGMNYLYFYIWWRILTGQVKDLNLKKGHIFKVPFLFIYGENSPFRFHSNTFAQKMKQKPNGYVMLKGHGHWAMYDGQGKEFNRVMLEWLQRTDEDSSVTSGNHVESPKL